MWSAAAVKIFSSMCMCTACCICTEKNLVLLLVIIVTILLQDIIVQWFLTGGTRTTWGYEAPNCFWDTRPENNKKGFRLL